MKKVFTLAVAALLMTGFAFAHEGDKKKGKPAVKIKKSVAKTAKSAKNLRRKKQNLRRKKPNQKQKPQQKQLRKRNAFRNIESPANRAGFLFAGTAINFNSAKMC